jgi:parallel beta-helix repeat protein
MSLPSRIRLVACVAISLLAAEVGFSASTEGTENGVTIESSVRRGVRRYLPIPTLVRVSPDYDAHTRGWGYTRFSSIQEAIAAVRNGGTVVVGGGRYLGTVDIDKTIVLTGASVEDSGAVLLTGDLRIRDGGNLTTRNISLKMDFEPRSSTQILVEPGGSLYIFDNTVIDALHFREYGFRFDVRGDAFEMRDAALHGCSYLRIETDDAVVEDSTISDCHSGLDLRASGAVVRGSTILRNFVDGITMRGAEKCRIENNHIEKGEGGGWPIYMVASHDNEIVNNTIVDTIVIAGSDRNLFEYNSIVGGQCGINMMYSCDQNVIRYNTVSPDEAGFVVWGWDNRVEHNTVSGEVMPPHTGIYLVNAYNTLVANNDFLDVGGTHGIYLRHSSNNLIADNTASFGERPGHAVQSAGVFLFSGCTDNLILRNTLSGFQRGIGLFFGCDENTIAGNEVNTVELEGLVIDGSSGNVIHADNLFVDVGLPAYDDGENTWDYEGAVPEWELATPPSFAGLDTTITGDTLYENETIYVSHIEVAQGASLTLRNVTAIMGGKRDIDSEEEGIFYKTGLYAHEGGSLEIYDSQLVHDPYGYGYQIEGRPGSKLRIINNDIRGCGSEWWAGGVTIATEDAVVEDNVVCDSDINFAGPYGTGRLVRNHVCNSHVGFYGDSGEIEIRDNDFEHVIWSPIDAQPWVVSGDVTGNSVAHVWSTAINLSMEDGAFENNSVSAIHGPFPCVSIGGNNVTVRGNDVSGCYTGFIISGDAESMDIVDNTMSDVEIGLQTGNGSRIEGNRIEVCGTAIATDGNDNTISGNLFKNCATGVVFTSPGSSGNIVHGNDFIDNSVQARDNGSNAWDRDGRGNYWSDYTGTDGNSDGIGDSSRPVPPNGEDRYPLMNRVTPDE